MSSLKALVVEDSPASSLICTRVLQSEGFEVSAASDGAGGISAGRTEHPDLIILDVTLPDIDGFEVCRQLREFTDAYVVMVTGRDEENDKLVGLAVGADDYITKPYSPRELAARIRAMRRRPRAAPEPEPVAREHSGVMVDPVAGVASIDGRVLELTKVEFDLLDALTADPDRTFTRRQLIDHVWGTDWSGGEHLIAVHIADLRRKLGESAESPRLIRYTPAIGYRFGTDP
jgi:DNA-binding response OmpR family regulator